MNAYAAYQGGREVLLSGLQGNKKARYSKFWLNEHVTNHYYDLSE